MWSDTASCKLQQQLFGAGVGLQADPPVVIGGDFQTVGGDLVLELRGQGLQACTLRRASWACPKGLTRPCEAARLATISVTWLPCSRPLFRSTASRLPCGETEVIVGRRSSVERSARTERVAAPETRSDLC